METKCGPNLSDRILEGFINISVRLSSILHNATVNYYSLEPSTLQIECELHIDHLTYDLQYTPHSNCPSVWFVVLG